ncbi:hypothetical protein [Aequorivita sp. KMM 9714]|uniref:hypothetical protein n=1 Tax=Aequorivita sp. KMM 9714 TaxID=2707173 RepID=UPI0013EE16A0|nr:hypothetical protein [Aequorivita sp. KMM 9714]NGX83111.1 hypothetical protein [Aequorivita sp. KMM 9714]
MNTGINKPKRHELQSDLLAIAEIPDRVKVTTSIRLQELIIYVNSEIQNRLRDINHLLLAQPTTTFEHWAQNAYSVFNYNQLIQLREIIQNEINGSLNYNDKIFKDAPSQMFFEFLFYKFISKDKYPKTAVEYVFRQFYDTGKSIDLVEMDYSIKEGQMREFAEYYNSFIIDKITKEKLKDFKIKITLNDAKIKSLYLIGNKENRKVKFNSLLSEFIRNNKTVG